MQRIGEFVTRHYRLLALALAAVLLATMLLTVQGLSDLQRYRDLLRRGELVSCRSSLVKALVGKPDWHEARDLLIDVEIQAWLPGDTGIFPGPMFSAFHPGKWRFSGFAESL